MTKIQSPEPLVNSANRLGVLHSSITPSRVTPASGRKPRRQLSPSEIRQRAADREEMQSLLAKLKELVPGIPKKRKLSKLEIIQHVIDYIFDLQVALDAHPDFASFPVGAPLQLVDHSLSMQFAQYQSPVTHSLPPQSCDAPSQFYSSQRISNGRTAERQPLASIML